MTLVKRTLGDVKQANKSQHAAPDDRGPDDRLLPGMTIAGGKIRLLISYDGPSHLQFWQAADTVTGQQLAVTLVDPDGALPAGAVDAHLTQTARLRGIEMPGLARVIDVGRDHCGGVVVSEWIRGATLKEVADTGPSPVRVADAVQSLTEAAEAAHRAGLTLSVDHPGRVRVSTDGDVVLAFPATMTAAMPQDDLEGIGAVLYALLVNRWPLGEQSTVAGWNPIELDAEGRPAEPVSLDSRVPFLISTTAAGLVREGSAIRSAETVSTVLRGASDEARKCEIFTTTREPPALPRPGSYAGFRNFGPVEKAEFARRQLLKTFLGTAAAVIVVVLTMFASTVSGVLGSGDTKVAATVDKLGLHTPSPVPPAPQAVPAPVVSIEPVKPLKASVFSPGGTPDNPNSAALSIDGDPATAWSTDTYYDAVPFPKFKEGVGLLLELPHPTSLSTVTVRLASTGTVVQIRSSPTPTPAKLSDTTELSPPTPLQPGDNRILVNNPAPTRIVLIWISTLGSTGGKNRSEISEVTLQTANPSG